MTSLLPKFNRKFAQALVSEFLCTFIFMTVWFHVKLANDYSRGLLGLIMAITSTALIYTFGPISGGHFNPAITFAAFLARRLNWLTAILYVVFQVGGGMAAAAAFNSMHFIRDRHLIYIPKDNSITEPSLFETFLTAVLCLVVYATCLGLQKYSGKKDVESLEEDAVPTADKHRLNFAPLAIGLTIGFLCYLNSEFYHPAFNPMIPTCLLPFVPDTADPNQRLTRLVGGRNVNFTTGLTLSRADFASNLWVYWVSDFSGATVANVIYYFFTL